MDVPPIQKGADHRRKQVETEDRAFNLPRALEATGICLDDLIEIVQCAPAAATLAEAILPLPKLASQWGRLSFPSEVDVPSLSPRRSTPVVDRRRGRRGSQSETDVGPRIIDGKDPYPAYYSKLNVKDGQWQFPAHRKSRIHRGEPPKIYPRIHPKPSPEMLVNRAKAIIQATDEHTKCGICQEDLLSEANRSPIVVKHCLHAFCESCISQWMMKSKMSSAKKSNMCPLCRCHLASRRDFRESPMLTVIKRIRMATEDLENELITTDKATNSRPSLGTPTAPASHRSARPHQLPPTQTTTSSTLDDEKEQKKNLVRLLHTLCPSISVSSLNKSVDAEAIRAVLDASDDPSSQPHAPMSASTGEVNFDNPKSPDTMTTSPDTMTTSPPSSSKSKRANTNFRLAGSHDIAQRPFPKATVFVQFVLDPTDPVLGTKPFHALLNKNASHVQPKAGSEGLYYEVSAHMRLSNLGLYCGTRLAMDAPVYFSIPGLLLLSKLYCAGNDKKGIGSPFIKEDAPNESKLYIHPSHAIKTGLPPGESNHECPLKPDPAELMTALQHHSVPLDPYMTVGEVVQECLSYGSLDENQLKLAPAHDVHTIGVRLPIELGRHPSVPLILNVRRSPFCTAGLDSRIIAGIPPLAPASAHLSVDLASVSSKVNDLHRAREEQKVGAPLEYVQETYGEVRPKPGIGPMPDGKLPQGVSLLDSALEDFGELDESRDPDTDDVRDI